MAKHKHLLGKYERRTLVFVGVKPRNRMSRYHKHGIPLWLRRRMIELRARPTVAETEFRTKLDKLGVDYVFQAGWVGPAGICAIFDFYLPLHRKIIEIDGGYHTVTEQQTNDAARDWLSRGILHIGTIRLSNEEAMTLDPEHVAGRIGRPCSRKEDLRLLHAILR